MFKELFKDLGSIIWNVAIAFLSVYVFLYLAGLTLEGLDPFQQFIFWVFVSLHVDYKLNRTGE